MNRSWIVRAVALLLVLVGLQSGAFRDPHAGHDWYFGHADDGAVMLADARKADPQVAAEPATGVPVHAAAPAAAAQARRAAPPAIATASLAPFLLPDPTGPPAA